MKTPILIVNDERWSREAFIVFEDDPIIGGCIPDDWVTEAYEKSCEDAQQYSYDPPTREQIAHNMQEEFLSENTTVDKFWAEKNICYAGGYYYRYDNDGAITWFDNELPGEEVCR